MPFNFTTLLWGCLVFLGLWLMDHVGVYLKWMGGCLLSVLLVAGGSMLLIVLHDFLRNF